MRILIVDDNKFDIRLAQRALKAAGVQADRIATAGNGKEALTFLTDLNGHTDRIRPDLVLLDLNMPQMDGFEFLEAIRQGRNFGAIPIIILTTSSRQEDVDRCYMLRCNAFHSKPSDIGKFDAMMCALMQYWSTFAKLPAQ